MKKKKKKKTAFDLDAAMAEDDNAQDGNNDAALAGDSLDLDENLDLENFGKKKKKKKKPFNLDDLDSALPASTEGGADDGAGEIVGGAGGDDAEKADDDFDLDMDFSKTKKKKKKKKDLDELVAEKTEEEKSEDKENGKLVPSRWFSWFVSIRFINFTPLRVGRIVCRYWYKSINCLALMKFTYRQSNELCLINSWRQQ